MGAELDGGPVALPEERERVPSRARTQLPVVVTTDQPDHHDRAELVGRVVEQCPVQLEEEGGGIRLAHGEVPDDVPDERGDRRGGDALAGHVANDDQPLAVGHLKDVVEVAADLTSVAGGAVRRRHRQSVDRRWRRWDQGLLQRLGELGRVLPGRLGGADRFEEIDLVATTVAGLEHHHPDPAQLGTRAVGRRSRSGSPGPGCRRRGRRRARSRGRCPRCPGAGRRGCPGRCDRRPVTSCERDSSPATASWLRPRMRSSSTLASTTSPARSRTA